MPQISTGKFFEEEKQRKHNGNYPVPPLRGSFHQGLESIVLEMVGKFTVFCRNRLRPRTILAATE